MLNLWQCPAAHNTRWNVIHTRLEGVMCEFVVCGLVMGDQRHTEL